MLTLIRGSSSFPLRNAAIEEEVKITCVWDRKPIDSAVERLLVLYRSDFTHIDVLVPCFERYFDGDGDFGGPFWWWREGGISSWIVELAPFAFLPRPSYTSAGRSRWRLTSVRVHSWYRSIDQVEKREFVAVGGERREEEREGASGSAFARPTDLLPALHSSHLLSLCFPPIARSLSRTHRLKKKGREGKSKIETEPLETRRRCERDDDEGEKRFEF